MGPLLIISLLSLKVLVLESFIVIVHDSMKFGMPLLISAVKHPQAYSTHISLIQRNELSYEPLQQRTLPSCH